MALGKQQEVYTTSGGASEIFQSLLTPISLRSRSVCRVIIEELITKLCLLLEEFSFDIHQSVWP